MNRDEVQAMIDAALAAAATTAANQQQVAIDAALADAATTAADQQQVAIEAAVADAATIITEEKEEEVDAGAGAGASVSVGFGAAVVGTSNAQRDEEFPDAFYCPLTEKIMVDPVVDTSGKSFERSAKISKDKREKITGVTYYPNRALKTIIERELERRDEKVSIRGKVRALNESLRSGFDKLVEKSALPSAERRPLPDSFYCPITLELIRKPVIDPDGRTFELDAIVNWIRVNRTSPITRNALAVSQLRSNEALRDLIEDEKERTDESIHPSIRRWKMEEVQTVEMDESIHPSIRRWWMEEVQTVETGAVEDTGNNQNYPTTQAEIDARARQSRSVKCSTVAVIFLILVVLASLFFYPLQILYFFWIAMYFGICTTVCRSSCRRVRGVERRRSENGTD
jgi:hypothetical protein